ncbi:MAG: sialidase family protein [Bryobacteraceae bacterium]
MQTIPRRTILAGGLALTAPAAGTAVKVASVRRAFHNGEHNAFTDMVRFSGRMYLTFRTCPEGHMLFPSSRILVLESENGHEWRQVHEFGVPKRDVRDPHFLVFRDRLFVYTGTWYCGDAPPKTRDMNEMLGFAASSTDGRTWSGPQMLEGTYGHYIWRSAAFGGKAWLCARRKRLFPKMEDRADSVPFVQSALLQSDDGIVFRKAGFFQEDYGNETALLFERDGTILALARGGGERNAELCTARPPYSKFERRDLGRYVGGPMIARWGSRYLAGGRRKGSPGDPVTALYWLDPAKAELAEIATLPSGGDNSYPGFIERSPTRGLLSYYSTHETLKAAIFLAELEVA